MTTAQTIKYKSETYVHDTGLLRKLGRGLILYLSYFIVATLVTWPLVTNLSTHLPGGSTDTYLHYWNGWWIQQALSQGTQPFYTTLLFYPQGVNLITHNIAWFQVIPWLFLQPFMNGIAAYNLALLINLAFCGFTAFFLVRHLVADVRIAFLGGLIYLAWPFRLSQLDHPNLLATQWIPLFLLLLIMTIRNGRLRDAILMGVVFAMVGYARWQQLIPATLMGITYVVTTLPFWAREQRWQRIQRLFVGAGLSILLLSPMIGLLLWQQSNTSDLAADVIQTSDETGMQTDLLAYITPASNHFLFGKITADLYDQYYRDRYFARRFPAYLGILTILLMLIGLWRRPKESLPWVVMGGLLILLALGPLLRINGRFLPQIPTLYQQLEPLMLFRLMRVPDRYNVFLATPVVVLASYGLAIIVQTKWMQSRTRQTFILPILAILLLFDYLAFPQTFWSATSPSPFYTQLAQESGDFAVMNLPFHPLHPKEYMFEQTIHGRPIVQGNVSRLPKNAFTFVDSVPALNALHYTNEFPPKIVNVSAQLALLANKNIRYIIIHKNLVDIDRIAHWMRYLMIEPSYEDSKLLVLDTTPQNEQDYQILHELLPGLGPVSVLTSTGCLAPQEHLAVDVGWADTRKHPQETNMSLALVNKQGQMVQNETFLLPASAPDQHLFWQQYLFTLNETIAPGNYMLQLRVADTPAQQPMTIQPISVQATKCNLATVEEADDANAIFNQQIRLLEYEVWQDADGAQFRLYWQAEQHMESDYTIFIHVFDPATNMPVAQQDVMPHSGAYTTSNWWPGEVVIDRFTVPLWDAPAGEYGIAIGLYNATTGERLILENHQREVVEDGRFILQQTIQIP